MKRNHLCRKDDMFKVPHWKGDEIFVEKMLSTDEYFEIALVYSKDKLIKVI